MANTTYTNVFGGSVISPAQVSEISYTLTANLALVWPQETAPNSNLAAQIIELSVASTGTFQVNLPPASQVSNGYFLIINNLSLFTQQIADVTGSLLIAAVAPGAIYFLYVRDNSTPAGLWGAFQYGAQISAPSAAALAGFGLKATGATLSQEMPIQNLVTNYTATANDRDKFLNWGGAGSGTFTLPAASSAGTGWYLQVRNTGGSVLTLQAVGSDTINGGGSTLAFNPGDSAFVVCDGQFWYTIGFGTDQTSAFAFISIDVPSNVSAGVVTLQGAQLNAIAYRFTGALTQNTVIDVPGFAQQYWVDNETTGAFTLTVQVPTTPGGATPVGSVVSVPHGARVIMYCDGSNMLNASTGGLAVPIAINQGGTAATTAAAALTNLGGTSTGTALFTAASGTAARNALSATSVADAYVLSMVN